MAQVRLESINKHYGKNHIVKDFTLDIKDGEFIVLLGPSGCGKSTLLRMVAGLESITSGDLFIGPRRVNNVDAKERELAMVFQSYALYPHMTVAQNIGFSLKISGEKKPMIAEKVQKVADMLELGALLHRKPSELSGGQRQRVAMGRAMVRSPELFLFDEPLSNLDSKLRGQMRDEIKEMHDKLKTTTIYVTHDQVEAMTLADRIVVLRNGVIEQVGTPEEVFTKPSNKFVASFIGNPSMNFFDVTSAKNAQGEAILKSEGLEIPLGQTSIKAIEEGRKLVIGIRPTDIALNKDLLESERLASVSCLTQGSELLGSESLISARVGDSTFKFQVPGQVRPKTGEKLEVFFKLESLHVFDKETTKSL